MGRKSMSDAEPECAGATLNGKPMHRLAVNWTTGECVMCEALKAAYKRGVDAALNGWEGF